MRHVVLLITVVGVALLLAAGAPKPAEAQEAPPPKTTYSWSHRFADESRTASFATSRITCQWNQYGYLTVGGRVFMQEWGKSNITQFRVQYLLYALGDNRPIDLPEWKYDPRNSPTFPNDYRNFYWSANKTAQYFRKVMPTRGWVLRAKMTWVKKNQRDINKTVDIGRCNGGEGYVDGKYYREFR